MSSDLSHMSMNSLITTNQYRYYFLRFDTIEYVVFVL